MKTKIVGAFLVFAFVCCTHVPVPVAPTVQLGGGSMVYGSGPMAPGWIAPSNYVPFNGTSCVFQQGCMLPN